MSDSVPCYFRGRVATRRMHRGSLNSPHQRDESLWGLGVGAAPIRGVLERRRRLPPGRGGSLSAPAMDDTPRAELQFAGWERGSGRVWDGRSLVLDYVVRRRRQGRLGGLLPTCRELSWASWLRARVVSGVLSCLDTVLAS